MAEFVGLKKEPDLIRQKIIEFARLKGWTPEEAHARMMIASDNLEVPFYELVSLLSEYAMVEFGYRRSRA